MREQPSCGCVTELETPRLRLVAWRDEHREPYAALNRDPEVMEHFPALQTREQSDAAVDLWSEQLATRGWSNWAAERRDTGEFIGFIGLTVPRRAMPCGPCVEVSWRLARPHWGQGLASEGARAALAFGFDTLGLDEIVSFTALTNRRSSAVMERIGMRNSGEDFDHPGVPEGSPLRRHCLYRLARSEWQVLNPLSPP